MAVAAGGEVAGYLARWKPAKGTPQAAAGFARAVVAASAPGNQDRAKCLPWASSKLASWAIPPGMEPVPEVLLHPSVTERFAVHAPAISSAARRTLRTNLRFLARCAVPHLDPADEPLSRERAKKPYSPAEIAGYLALAGAQPAQARAMRATALVCLGAGAGLIRSDLRNARGTDVAARSGGVVVEVRGRAPRAVPVLARYQPRLLEAAAFAGENFLTGGDKPERGNITNPLTRSLAGGGGLPPLDTSRLRATWLAECAALTGLPAFMHAAGMSCCQRLGDITAGLDPGSEQDAIALLGATAAGGARAVSIPLAVIEQIVSGSGVAEAVELMLPAGARERQLKARTLLTGMMLALADGRPAHLTRILEALTGLPEDDQKRPGVIAQWDTGPHQLTYRQVEHTSRLIRKALAKAKPDGAPPADLQRLCDQLPEASIPAERKQASSSPAADWTDVQAWARAVPASSPGTGADPEARWGHRNVNRKIELGEMFFGYYMPAATMVNDEDGLAVPELARRITVCSSAHDPAAALVPVLAGLAASGARPGDILADSGFSYRAPGTWANPLRGLGAQLVVDLHPQDRGPQGTHEGAVTCNGNLYCPQTPKPLLQLIPLPPGASAAEVAAHDQQTAELSRYKLGLHATEDADGYRRLACPAATGKIRCPLRPASMKLERSRPETLAPPGHPPACCAQKTITAGPGVAAKTRQKHDYPSAAWRRSYRRRTASERLNASVKDTATGSIDRGWIRLTGITPLTLWLTCMTVVRNQRILAAWQARHRDDARRAAEGPPPRTRKPRRELATAGPAPP